MSLNRDLLALAASVAEEAVALAHQMRSGGVDVAQTKTSETDVVTAADQAVQQLIRRRLLQARPDDGFLGEEGDGREGTSGIRWVVDPIDGTVNYLYGIDQWAISIAAESSTQVLAGVVHAAHGAVYTSARGHGAFLNGEPIQVRHQVDRGHRLIHVGFNYQPQVRALQARYVAQMLPRVRDIRRMGSAALDICMVAAGKGDGYVEECVHHWDRAAALLIAHEAGASFEVATSPSGNDLVICAPSHSYADFRRLVTDCGFILEG